MCRLVVRNRDKVNADDPYLNARCLKRGMIVDILDDGQSLGAVGDKYDGWTVVDMPGVPVEKMLAYVAPEPGDEKLDKMLQRRAFVFDLDAWELQGGKGGISPGKVDVEAAKGALLETEALALKKSVTKLIDPNVIGEAADPMVL